jgi:hypothetical protein
LGKERRFRNEDSTYLCIYNRTYKKIADAIAKDLIITALNIKTILSKPLTL